METSERSMIWKLMMSGLCVALLLGAIEIAQAASDLVALPNSVSNIVPIAGPDWTRMMNSSGQTQRSKFLHMAKADDLTNQSAHEIKGKDGASMLLVPGGQFWMGSGENDIERVIEDCKSQLKKDEASCKGRFASEQPRHQVALDAFYLDIYEVTNRFFDKFVRATGYQTTAEKEGSASAWIEGKGYQDKEWKIMSGAAWRQPEAGPLVFESDRADHPVVSVSWHDAEAYCRWAGKRLPTEAEFEYAVRAGTQTLYWWGDGAPGTRRVANVADEGARRVFSRIMEGYDDGYIKTAPVGSYEANPFGLFDMTGNVSEWTADWFGADYYGASSERNPTGPPSGPYRVLRGGNWYSEAILSRSAYRNRRDPLSRSAIFGFRCAQDGPK